MDVIRTANKGKNLDIPERLYIYKAARNKSILNEQYATDSNVLLNIIINRDKNKLCNTEVGKTETQWNQDGTVV
jgi:hypothetical protein